jgi:membrane protease YdiL (CAAX protease family)
MQPAKQNTDRIAGALLLSVAALFWQQLLLVNNPLDRIFPRFILIVMTILSIVLLVKSFVKPDLKSLFCVENKKNLYIGAIGIIIWAVLLNVLGFIVSGISIYFGFSLVLGKDDKKTLRYILKSLLISLIIVLIIYFLFSQCLEVPLPKGIFL